MRREAVTELPRLQRGLIATAFTAAAAAAGFVLWPATAAMAFIALALAWIAGATAAFDKALALPLIEPLFAGFVALIVAIGFRFGVSDRDKRLLRKSFALYLAPSVIEKMVASSTLPVLGGETRTVTVFFSDIAGFTALSETMEPAALVASMNVYFSAMTDLIEEHGGCVTSISATASWRCSARRSKMREHAANAVRAALRCGERLAELNRSAAAFEGRAVGHRIGLNSGEALVGNVGSGRRFNYTVMGDAVNLLPGWKAPTSISARRSWLRRRRLRSPELHSGGARSRRFASPAASSR